MLQRILFNFQLALEGVVANKLRAFLTALGIVFGVAAVIAMLAIGTGAKQAILEQMKLIGTNNIVITAGKKDAEEEEENQEESVSRNDKNPWSPGLSLLDVDALVQVIDGIETVSPEVVITTSAIQSGKLKKVKCVGIKNDFFALNNLQLGMGSLFHEIHHERGEAVCIIGKNVQNHFFPNGNALGEIIKCGNVWLRVVGVLEGRTASKENLTSLGIRDFNDDVYVPLQTALVRFENRAIIKSKHVSRRRGGGNRNYHQIDKLVIQVADAGKLRSTADYIARSLRRRHNDVLDFEVEVPELLLQQQQKTQDTFNMVLAVIAGISLLVGGIGIMNIMLASVLERIKEIGVRRSMGAYKIDIVLQFLFEAVFISLLGGVTGIILGVVAANLIANSAEIPTIISPWSIIISFGVAASIGLVFGIVPARRAANQDPIKALRSD